MMVQHSTDSTGDQFLAATAHLARCSEGLDGIRASLSEGVDRLETVGGKPAPNQELRVFYRVPRPYLEIIKAQFNIMQTWLEPILELTQKSQIDASEFRTSLDKATAQFGKMISELEMEAETSEAEHIQ